MFGPVTEVQILKIFDQKKNPSSNETKRTSYDLLISRGKSRFVDEVQILNSELRSSAGLLIELQKAGREES